MFLFLVSGKGIQKAGEISADFPQLFYFPFIWTDGQEYNTYTVK